MGCLTASIRRPEEDAVNKRVKTESSVGTEGGKLWENKLTGKIVLIDIGQTRLTDSRNAFFPNLNFFVQPLHHCFQSASESWNFKMSAQLENV